MAWCPPVVIMIQIQKNVLCVNDHQSTLVSRQKSTLVFCDDECLSQMSAEGEDTFTKLN